MLQDTRPGEEARTGGGGTLRRGWSDAVLNIWNTYLTGKVVIGSSLHSSTVGLRHANGDL